MSKQKQNIFYSSLGLKHMPNREKLLKNSESWLKDKRAADNVNNLWRVHDGLYDLSHFVKNHPGGSFWLRTTQGTDITEAFESHHITTLPTETLKKFYVCKADTPRNSPFTFADGGFYRTLKNNVREAIKTIPKRKTELYSNFIIDSLLIFSCVLSIIACRYSYYSLAILAGLFLSLTSAAGHNYYHKKDNFRMLYSDFSMGLSKEWRIIHVLSHHGFPNSASDLQAYGLEPMAYIYPHHKSHFAKYGSWIYVPLFAWTTLMHKLYISRLLTVCTGNSIGNSIDLIPLILPTLMYVTTNQPILSVIVMWNLIIMVNSFGFCVIGFTGTHHHPDVFTDGDTPSSQNGIDWGIYQLETAVDRYEVMGSHFLSLITLGDHALHHLFPTLDEGTLQYLYPVLEETMKQFNVEMNMTTQVNMFLGYFRQLKRENPNLHPPKALK